MAKSKSTKKQNQILKNPSQVPYNYKKDIAKAITAKEFVHTHNVLTRLKYHLQFKYNHFTEPPAIIQVAILYERPDMKRMRKQKAARMAKLLKAVDELLSIEFREI